MEHNDGIVGFMEEAKTITGHLLNRESKLDVISIVGMAGVGKTSLALTLCHTPSVVDHFDILAWSAVSQSYENRDVLLSILDQVDDSEKSHKWDDEELADNFCRSLKRRRYLILLDDIWDIKLWIYLKRYLPDDKNGSRVLVTTRNRNVADQIRSKVIGLHGLSEASSWELFQKKMLQKESLPEHLLKIAEGIVMHCRGLPLSIVIIAGILSGIERTEQKWNQIAKSVTKIILLHPKGNCKAVLELSYNHLANHLRSCFLYLGSFPEDQEISVNRLVIRWIGEGLVQDTNSESAEEVATKYIEDLIVKSLVIPAKEKLGGGVKTFRIHDLLRDFCLRKAKDENFFTLLDDKKDSRLPRQDPTRLVTNGPWIDDLSFSSHSILSLICYFDMKSSKIEKGIRSSDPVLLRVFEVEEICSQRFPNLSRLVNLRYLALGLEDSEIEVLPSSISKLQNLQILILKFEHKVNVPDFIWDMVKLRHIDISEEAIFEVDSKRLEKSSSLLDNLRSLSRARVSWVDSKWDSKWLRKLSGLQSLSCVFVEYDTDDETEPEGDTEDETEEEDAIDNDDSEEDDNTEDEEEDDDDSNKDDDTRDDTEEDDDDRKEENDIEDHKFGMVSFNDHLTSLKVRNDADWKQRFIHTCQLPSSLLELTLSNFSLTSNDISVIGRAAPQLKVLKIYNCSVPSGYHWNVDDEEFPELKVLKLRRLKIREWIVSESSFPILEQLFVEKCNRMKQIPLDFGSLENLRLITVRKCAPSVDDSARKIGREQHVQQNTNMRVRIYPRKW